MAVAAAADAPLDDRAGEPAPALAIVTPMGFICARDDSVVQREHEQWGMYLHPTLRTFATSCEQSPFKALVDDAGHLEELPRGFDFPSRFDPRFWVSWRIGPEVWLAMTGETSREVAFLRGQPGAWRVVTTVANPTGMRVGGVGAWPGGAVIAAFGSEATVGSVEVLSGTPAEPLPVVGQVGSSFDFATVPEGEAFGVWQIDRIDGGLMALHWRRGQKSPEAEVLPGVDLGTDARKLVAVSARQVYLPVVAGDVKERFVRVLRFDGKSWITSLNIEDAHSPVTLAAGPDGAMWVLVSEPDPVASLRRSSGVWRRAPGPEDSWQRIARDQLGGGTALEATSLLPFRGGAVFAGRLGGKWLGLHRIDLPEGPR